VLEFIRATFRIQSSLQTGSLSQESRKQKRDYKP